MNNQYPNLINENFPQIVFVEGNIGSGKTTLCQLIEKHKLLNSQVLYEPVKEWKETIDSKGVNILQHFYNDMSRNAYLFQSFAFISRTYILDQIDTTKDVVFIERSCYSDRNIFASSCKDTGILNEMEWITYCKWFDWMVKKYDFIFKDAIYLYIDCSPKETYSRIQKRNRKEEEKISLEYINSLDSKHRIWFENIKEKQKLVIDGNVNFKDNFTELYNIFKQIESKYLIKTNKEYVNVCKKFHEFGLKLSIKYRGNTELENKNNNQINNNLEY